MNHPCFIFCSQEADCANEKYTELIGFAVVAAKKGDTWLL